nr:HCLS1-associated protein X-1-like isoform X1 [Procambarus clarkii]
MDWFNKLFGFRERSKEDVNPFRRPTWEEIVEKEKYSNGMPRSDELFSSDLYSDRSFFSPGDSEDSFSSVFHQMDDMFRQLDIMMKGFHGHPGQMMITDIPDSETSERKSPRDYLLKVPDSDSQDGVDQPSKHTPQHPHSHYFGGVGPYHGHAEDNYQEGNIYFDESHSFGGFGLFDPHGMIDNFFKNFGWGLQGTPFGEFPNPHTLPGSDEDPTDHNAGSAGKKEDLDLDDRVTGGLSQLLKDGPSYSYESSPSPGSNHPLVTQPETTQPHSGVQQSYRSTSIVRIRRPDGTIEETKKYVDSSGREEVVVTHTQPDGSISSSSSPLEPGDYRGSNGLGHFPSIFSWIFTR